jgi:hypothetical protein
MEKVTIIVKLLNFKTEETKEVTIQVYRHFVAYLLMDDIDPDEAMMHFISLCSVITTLLDLPSNDEWDEDRGEWGWVEARTENGEILINF